MGNGTIIRGQCGQEMETAEDSRLDRARPVLSGLAAGDDATESSVGRVAAEAVASADRVEEEGRNTGDLEDISESEGKGLSAM